MLRVLALLLIVGVLFVLADEVPEPAQARLGEVLEPIAVGGKTFLGGLADAGRTAVVAAWEARPGS